MSELSEDQQQREDVKELLRDAIFSVDAWVIAHRDELLGEVTSAARTSLIVEAALASLVGNGLIRRAPEDEIPVFLSVDIPAHLLPDIASAKAEYWRLRQPGPGEWEQLGFTDSLGLQPSRESDQ